MHVRPEDKARILAQTTKSIILYHLPKGFHCRVSKNGLRVVIWVDTKKVRGGWEKADELVDKLAKKLKLNAVGAGTDLATMVRNWAFTDTEVEKQMVAEAKDVLKTMKSFFKKHGSTYSSSCKCYDVIRQMRALAETYEA